jgi:hypothetical protein
MQAVWTSIGRPGRRRPGPWPLGFRSSILRGSHSLRRVLEQSREVDGSDTRCFHARSERRCLKAEAGRGASRICTHRAFNRYYPGKCGRVVSCAGAIRARRWRVQVPPVAAGVPIGELAHERINGVLDREHGGGIAQLCRCPSQRSAAQRTGPREARLRAGRPRAGLEGETKIAHAGRRISKRRRLIAYLPSVRQAGVAQCGHLPIGVPRGVAGATRRRA